MRDSYSDPSAIYLDVQVTAEFGDRVDVGLLNTVICRALELEETAPVPVEIDLAIVDDKTIRDLNRRFRGIDQPTDVLSFPLQEGPRGSKNFVLPPGHVVNLGDVVISFPRAEAQAQEYGHSIERELAYLAVHGVFHLLGYDHETEDEREQMRSKEERALADLPR